MDIKKIFNSAIYFTLRRIIELFSVVLAGLSLLLVISLVSYSPDDPNFIFPDNTVIKNFLGSNGSYVSDIFMQSFGLMSFLIPITFFFTSINIFINKRLLLIMENMIFAILYLIFGCLFFSVFYKNSFWLSFNGNGGFVGNFLGESFLISLINLNNEIFYYILIILVICFFLLSVNFSLALFIISFKKIFTSSKKKEDYNEYSDDDIGENVINNISNDSSQEQANFKFSQNSLYNKSSVYKFKLPSSDFLNEPEKSSRETKKSDKTDETFLEKILLDFGVEGKIKRISHGPVVTLNEFEPAAGVKVSKIINLSEDIARNTSSESARISTIPGSSTIGIELPNQSRENVFLSEIINDKNFLIKDHKLPIALGKSISGVPIIGDLSSMPHLLIAGTTGSGKSVCINTIILSLLYKHAPDKCKFILIDPKMLELSTYEGIPHLLCPVITEAKRAASVLGWVVKEMENRYRLMTKEGVRNIDGYNDKHKKLPMPFIVVIVDEMSDLMLFASKEIESYIQKLSQMARAAGIHIIMATQRPSVDVITGTIKANFPTRISFKVTSKIDSRTILGEQGAEQLLGKGDMLYMSSANKIIRIHAPFVSESEIEKVNNFLRSQEEPRYVDEILNFADEKENKSDGLNSENEDELYNTALEIVKSEKKASTSFLQRKLQIGYNRAARIIDMMEANGEVSKANHVGKREILK